MTPPHVSLTALRNALGLTLDQVCALVAEATDSRPMTRGAMSAIESGTRGASQQAIEGLEKAYGLRTGDIDTQYTPRSFAA